MIFFTVVFTLAGHDAASNLYVHMLVLMLETLKRTKTFIPEEDLIYVMTDAETEAVLQKFHTGVMRYVKCIRIPQPTDLLEGISRRYEFFHHVYRPETTTLYLDVDFLCRRQFRADLPADTIAVLAEGGSKDPNYCGEGDWAQLEHPGLSAGFWAMRPGARTLCLMDEIKASIRRGPHNFYTVEQPHFNAAITKRTPAVMFDPRIVSFNGNLLGEGTFFINLAGCPGDGPFHFIKQLDCFLSLV